MDEYIKREDALEFVCKSVPHFSDGYTTIQCVKRAIKEVPAAAVAPKSEVDDWIITAKENLVRIEELEKELKNVKADVTKEIFEEIERMCIDTFGNFNHRVFAELKKKYTEELI